MDFGAYLDYAIAAAIVLALLVIAMLVLRAVGGRVRARQGSRLGISEYHEIDKQRRLVLVRRDGVEHLLLMGGARDLVIEVGIGAGPAVSELANPGEERRPPMLSEVRQSPVLASPEPGISRTIPLRAAPRPAVFGDRSPESPKRAEPRLEPVSKSESQGEG